MKGTKLKKAKELARARRVRACMQGTAQFPRLTVKRSAKHVYAQLIDDQAGRTLASCSDHEVKEAGKPVQKAKQVGQLLAKKAEVIGVRQAVFDRGSYRYHGRVAAVAEGAREGGLTI